MAKTTPKNGETGKVKVRVIEFEMDGSDQSIADTMRTLAAAFSGGGQGAVPVHRRLKTDPAPALAGADAERKDELDGEYDSDVEDVVVKPFTVKKPRAKVTTYEILDDIRFDQTAVSLVDFVAQYNLKSDLKRYLAIALWYKEELKLAEINVRHWYTAFKYLKWSMPDVPAQPIRDLRANKTLSKGTTTGHSFVNHIGEKDLAPLKKVA